MVIAIGKVIIVSTLMMTYCVSLPITRLIFEQLGELVLLLLFPFNVVPIHDRAE